MPDIDLDGVEFKSLPSGLHSVKEDLVYYVHGNAAGISIFAQDEADAKQRNANFVAVGALVPLSYGRLGKSWVFGEELRILAKQLVKNASDTRAMELFWQKYRLDHVHKRQNVQAPLETPDSNPDTTARKRKRAFSDAMTGGVSGEAEWPSDHPVLSMPALLTTFGPLIFPLHRAALLRKRILLLGTPPVQKNSNAVYLMSILSTPPESLRESIPPEAESLFYSHPLFSVGIQDMTSLIEGDGDIGWLACTTDDILGEKKDVFDVLVKVPTSDREWPQIQTSDGKGMKCSRRDLRRWKLLQRELRRLKQQKQERFEDEPASETTTSDDERPLLEEADRNNDVQDEPSSYRQEGDVSESSAWADLAYRGFIWWASAGDADAWEADERKEDEEVFDQLPNVAEVLPDPKTNSNNLAKDQGVSYARATATLVVAYFRRLTELLMTTAANIVEQADHDTDNGSEENGIQLDSDDLREMGLDPQSDSTREFIKDLFELWFKQEAVVADNGIRICGLRVC